LIGDEQGLGEFVVTKSVHAVIASFRGLETAGHAKRVLFKNEDCIEEMRKCWMDQTT
jgi:hypothetical protein